MRTYFVDTSRGRHEVQANDPAGARETFRLTTDADEAILQVIGLTEVVHVHTFAGTFHIDFSESFEQRLLDLQDEPETTGEAMTAVERACEARSPLVNTDGKPVLISARGIIAMTYERKEGQSQ